MYCAKCGHEVKENERFCGNCGDILESNEEGNRSKDNRGTGEDDRRIKRKNNKGIIAVTFVIIFIVAGYLGIRFFSPVADDTGESVGNNPDSKTEGRTDSEAERKPAFPEELMAFGKILFEEKWLENNTYYADDPDSVTFLIIDINKDGINEMAVFQEYGNLTSNADITTYLLVYDNERVIIDNIGGSYLGYNEKNNYFLTGNFKGGYSDISVHTLNDHNSIEKVYSLWDNRAAAPPFTFNINEEEVTEKKYDDFIDSLEVKNTGEYAAKRFSSENIKSSFNIEILSKGEASPADNKVRDTFPKEFSAFGKLLFEDKWLENNTYYVDDPDSVTFLIVDLNQDGIKELAVFQEFGDLTANAEVTTYLFTYDDKEVRIDNIGGSYYGYSMKNNYLLTGYFKGGYCSLFVNTLNDDNNIETVYSLWDNRAEAPPYTYTINEEEVTESKYETLIDSFESMNTGEYGPKLFTAENIKTYFNMEI